MKVGEGAIDGGGAGERCVLMTERNKRNLKRIEHSLYTSGMLG